MSNENPLVDVRTMIPANEFRFLHTLAAEHRTTVGALVAELVHRGLTGQGAKRKPRTVIDDAGEMVLRRMHAAGHSKGEIAEVLGVSPSAVYARRRELGLKSRPGRRSNQQLERLTPRANNNGGEAA